MGKCLYCCKETDNKINLTGYDGFHIEEQLLYCCENHENSVRQYLDFVNRYGKRYMLFICSLCFLFAVFIPLSFIIRTPFLSEFLGVSPLFGLGTVIYKYPFATPFLIDRWGVQKCIKNTKVLGKSIEYCAVILCVLLCVVCEFIL